jgi:hypothetical protein
MHPHVRARIGFFDSLNVIFNKNIESLHRLAGRVTTIEHNILFIRFYPPELV